MCQCLGTGQVCAWCGRDFAASAAEAQAAFRWRNRVPALVIAAVAVAVMGALVALWRMPPSEVGAVLRAFPGLGERLENKGHTCDWSATPADEPGRAGWKVARCKLEGGDTGPAWYVTPIKVVYAHNAAAKLWSESSDPPEIAAWDRQGTDCTMMEYYDNCMADVVIDHVRRAAPAPLPALQHIADQTLSFSAGHSAALAAKIAKCGGGSFESRCGQFTREIEAVNLQVVQQIAAQRSQNRLRAQDPAKTPQ